MRTLFSNTIRKELKNYLIDLIDDNVLTIENLEDWHYLAFNESYYIYGDYECQGWLDKHNVSLIEAINIVKDYELEHFGDFTTNIDLESITNMFVYVLGEILLNNELNIFEYEYNSEIIDVNEIKEQITNL